MCNSGKNHNGGKRQSGHENLRILCHGRSTADELWSFLRVRYAMNLVKKVIKAAAVFLAAFAVVIVAEVVYAIDAKRPLLFTNPSPDPVHFGQTGSKLTYLVIGDSTGAGEGAPYVDGIAVGTAKHLAMRHRVSLVNLSVSGATTTDVVRTQLVKGARLRPDIVLLAVGANDATHFIPNRRIRSNLNMIISALHSANPAVTIVVTGCPQMGSIPRFLTPLSWIAHLQTARVNRQFASPAHNHDVIWVHIADETGAIFARNPGLFAPDEFHPNAQGYAVWLRFLNEGLDRADM